MITEKDTFKNVCRNCIKEWFIFRIILFIIILCPFVIVLLLEVEETAFVIAKYVGLFFSGLLVLWCFVYTFIFPKLQYNRLQYCIGSKEIEKQSGVIFLRKQVVPFNRIQHIELYRGVLDRTFKMSTVLLFTAGSVVRIQNLDIRDAECLIGEVKSIIDSDGEVND